MSEKMPFQFKSKAETLVDLKKLLKFSKIAEIYYFNHAEWKTQSNQIIKTILKKFEKHESIVIRSSSVSEDTHLHSNAGAFQSFLNVGKDQNEIRKKINLVFRSYGKATAQDQVLIQPMLSNVAASGVITTKVLQNGSPYYVFNYDDESGKTDTITGGSKVNKMVMVYRDYSKSHLTSERLQSWLRSVKEIEKVTNDENLDIEFILDKKNVFYVAQVRPLAAKKNWQENSFFTQQLISDMEIRCQKFFQPQKGLFGKTAILGQMPDWNPAEIIGTHPNPLAVSLYKHLITDAIWSQARFQMGYKNVNQPLMHIIGLHPYIDVRASFNSLIPVGLEKNLSEKLVNAYIEYLDTHPEFHDKVEFRVLFTVMVPQFFSEFEQRFPKKFSKLEKLKIRKALVALTKRCMEKSKSNSLWTAIDKVEGLVALQAGYKTKSFQRKPLPERISILLEDCKKYGTLPFAIIARHAFIAETLLKSFVKKGILSQPELDSMKHSWPTITTEFAEDLNSKKVGKKEFLEKYGHLRPGTYDINSLTYNESFDFNYTHKKIKHSIARMKLNSQQVRAIQTELEEMDLDLNCDAFLEYARLSITHREYSKFIFTKNLSMVLDLIALWCEQVGCSREVVSHSTIHEILRLQKTKNKSGKTSLERNFVESINNRNRLSYIKLGYLIRGIKDLNVVPVHRSLPNFITDKKISASVQTLDVKSAKNLDLENKIIFIENADPGFDWIFTKSISGLVTKFGGVNSHMAIRCTEFSVPAAIGCGELLFESLKNAKKVFLNCHDKFIREHYE